MADLKTTAPIDTVSEVKPLDDCIRTAPFIEASPKIDTFAKVKLAGEIRLKSLVDWKKAIENRKASKQMLNNAKKWYYDSKNVANNSKNGRRSRKSFFSIVRFHKNNIEKEKSASLQFKKTEEEFLSIMFRNI